jgi:hypothetical protein
MAAHSEYPSDVRAKRVLGTKVIDPSGKKTGEIEEMVLEKLSNGILFAIVPFGSFPGMAETYYPIPFCY